MLKKLVLFILFISVVNLLKSNEFKEQRVKAIDIITTGVEDNKKADINKGLKLLSILSKKGDLESSYALAMIYLSGKAVNKNINKAYSFLIIGSEKCHINSLKALKIIFLNNKSSKYFSPVKYKSFNNRCEPDNKKEITVVEKKTKIKKNSIKPNFRDWEKAQSNVYFETEDVIGAGSAFAINPKGYFLTNRHVVDNCNRIFVIYNNFINWAKIISISKNMDAAIIKAESKTPYFIFFDDNEYKVGEKLYAAGFPGIVANYANSSSMSLSEGNITNVNLVENNKMTGKYMVISVPTSNGNSGGPLINSFGLLRGMSVGGFKEEDLEKDTVLLGGYNINIMVPGNELIKWARKLKINIEIKDRHNKIDAEGIGEKANLILGQIGCLR
tara:strand:+ start:607 stop:1764 length:1158 start_codon:yes stop_codon:yes gene_type:complete